MRVHSCTQAQLHVVSWGMKPEALHRKYLGTHPTLPPNGFQPPQNSQPPQHSQPSTTVTAAVHAAPMDAAPGNGSHVPNPGICHEGDVAGTHQEECHRAGAQGLGGMRMGSAGGWDTEGLGEEGVEEFGEDEGCAAWKGKEEEDDEDGGGGGGACGACGACCACGLEFDSGKWGSDSNATVGSSCSRPGDDCGSSIRNSCKGVAAASGAALGGGGPELRGRCQWRRVIGIRPTGVSVCGSGGTYMYMWREGGLGLSVHASAQFSVNQVLPHDNICMYCEMHTLQRNLTSCRFSSICLGRPLVLALLPVLIWMIVLRLSATYKQRLLHALKSDLSPQKLQGRIRGRKKR
eukprot:780008-Pelagomonas_calceolata.AAC.1